MTAPISNRNIREELESGARDLVIGYFSELDASLRVSKLREVNMACIVAENHSRVVDELDEATYFDESHVGVLLGSDNIPSFMESRIEEEFKARSKSRHVPVQVQSLFAVPHLVSQTELVGTLPLDVAKLFANTLPIKIMDCPFPGLNPTIVMVWHSRSDKDSAHRWLRSVFRNNTSKAT